MMNTTHCTRRLAALLRWLGAALIATAVATPAWAADPAAADTDYRARVLKVLEQTPLIDGHNDLPGRSASASRAGSRPSI